MRSSTLAGTVGGSRDNGPMTTIYRPRRCYGPDAGHYGWLFLGPDGRWYSGSLEMPNSCAPNWLHCKDDLGTLDEAIDWFERGGPTKDAPLTPGLLPTAPSTAGTLTNPWTEPAGSSPTPPPGSVRRTGNAL